MKIYNGRSSVSRVSTWPFEQASKCFFTGLRKRSSDGKELLWEIDCDMVTEIVKKYPMYKTKYYTVAFCDAASIMLKITEEKYGLPKNHLIAVANKY